MAIDKNVLKELSGCDRESREGRSVSLRTRSDLSLPQEQVSQSLKKDPFWGGQLGDNKESRDSRVEQKRKKMKNWLGKLKLKQVENPSIGLDLSNRSKSAGPKKDWKEEAPIREENEGEENRSEPASETLNQIRRISSYKLATQEAFMSQEMQSKGVRHETSDCNFEIYAGKFDDESIKEDKAKEEARQREVGEVLERVGEAERRGQGERELRRTKQLEEEVRALEREVDRLRGEADQTGPKSSESTMRF